MLVRCTRSSTMSWSPAAISSYGLQSSQRLAPVIRTLPDPVTTQSVPANRSPCREESRLHTPSWSSARMLRPMPERSRSLGHVLELRWMHTETRGGSIDTAVKELAANPTGTPSMAAQTALTPEGNRPKACLS